MAATAGVELAVAVVAAHDGCPSDVERLTSQRSDLKVLIATDAGVPRPVVLSLWAGASGVLEFRSLTKAEIVQEIREWVARHRQASREREFLMRLRDLNEEFLKAVVAAQKRVLELEEKLAPGSPLLGPQDEPASVLVVDDEAVVHDVLGRLLARRKHPFVSAMSGEQALEELKRRQFHLVLTDKNMPGVSGLDVLRHVKHHSPDTDVIVMTGYASMESAIEALNLGASGYIEKPFDDINRVAARIDEVLAKQRERLRRRHYLGIIKDRNRDFLERYKVIRADLDAWLEGRHGR